MSFSFGQFVSDSVRTVTSPADYFSTMPVAGGYLEPVVKAALYGLLSGVVLCALGLLKLTGVAVLDNPESAAMAVLAMPILVVLLSFVGGALLLVGAMACKGSGSYEAGVRCAASMMVLEPVNLLVDTLSMGGYVWAMVLSVLVSWFGLFLVFHALTKCLGARPKTAKILVVALAAFNAANTFLPLL